MGFIVAACKAHEARCSGRSPAERRTVNLRDETRWASAPPRSLITNPDDHAGLKDPA
jgi:hypothetical protein